MQAQPQPLATVATYRGTEAGWVAVGAPRPVAEAEALAALTARVRPDYITKARPAAALPVPPAPRRWHPGGTAEILHGLGVIGAAYAAVIIGLGALGLATGAHSWDAPAPAAPVVTLAP
jgi:hypothetical protein